MTTNLENICIPEDQTCGHYRFIPVPLCHQETEYTCGVACVQSILGCYGMDYRQDQLAQILQSRPILGTDYENIIRFMQLLGFQAFFADKLRLDDLKSYIKAGITPMLLIQAWGENGVDYATDWKDSHYVIACGYDENRIYFMDPYTLGYYTYIPTSELLKRWHVPDACLGRCDCGGLVIKKEHCLCQYNSRVVKYLG